MNTQDHLLPLAGARRLAERARPAAAAGGLSASRRVFTMRAALRFLWLIGEVAAGLVRYGALLVASGGRPDRAARCRWLQRLCRRGGRVLGVEVRLAGPAPTRGLLACNHLSYLDVLVLGAAVPCVFVSKSEVRRWPLFGWCAALAGTIFLQRGRRADVARVTAEMRRALEDGALVALFPEGTTTDSREVLPFKSSLLEPAVQPAPAVPVSAGCLHYALADGNVAEEVCYWGDMTLLPHLLNLLGRRRFEARLSFAELRPGGADRKELARQLHAEVARLKDGL